MARDLHLSEEAFAALRDMVAGWIDEGFRIPPYTDADYDVFEALELTNENRGGLTSYDIERPGEAGNA